MQNIVTRRCDGEHTVVGIDIEPFYVHLGVFPYLIIRQARL
jgi:hypothetical protein